MAKMNRPAGKSKPKAKARSGGATRRKAGGSTLSLDQLRSVIGGHPGGMNMMPQQGVGGGTMAQRPGAGFGGAFGGGAPGGMSQPIAPTLRQMSGAMQPSGPPMLGFGNVFNQSGAGLMNKLPMSGGPTQLPRFGGGGSFAGGSFGGAAPGSFGGVGTQPVAPQPKYPYPGVPPVSQGPM